MTATLLPADPSPLMDEGAAAALLGISRPTLKSLRLRGLGPTSVRIGGQVRYAQAAIDAYILLHTEEPKS